MNNVIIVETEEDKKTLENCGFGRSAGILVRNLNQALSTLRTCDINGQNVIFLLQTHSEEDKFFKSWMATAKDITDVDLILPVVPSLQKACEDTEWVEALKDWME